MKAIKARTLDDIREALSIDGSIWLPQPDGWGTIFLGNSDGKPDYGSLGIHDEAFSIAAERPMDDYFRPEEDNRTLYSCSVTEIEVDMDNALASGDPVYIVTTNEMALAAYEDYRRAA